jgi:hypothetical protein
MSEALALGRGGAVMRRLPRPLQCTRKPHRAAALGISAFPVRPGGARDIPSNRLGLFNNRRSGGTGTKLEG